MASAHIDQSTLPSNHHPFQSIRNQFDRRGGLPFLELLCPRLVAEIAGSAGVRAPGSDQVSGFFAR